MNIDALFSKLWEKYIQLAPNAKKIYKLFENTQKTKIINDHIALRTIDFNICNIDVVSAVFVSLGYEKKEYYYFDGKKLKAYYFKHKNDDYPKVFISALDIEKFDSKVKKILKSCINEVSKEILSSNSLSFSSRHWKIYYKTYKFLYSKSEYAAWFYVFGFTANHFTILVNKLESFKTLEEVNQFVKNNFYSLNSSGGEIKGSKEVFLEQSSTVAQSVNVEFEDGTYEIASCFYEFAKRYEDENNNLYHGFIAKSADLIFESTNNIKK